jgi:hypothetical protein
MAKRGLFGAGVRVAKAVLPAPAREFIYGVAFEIRARTANWEIEETPHVPPRAAARFMAEIATSRVYLEFGAGGSTIAAVQNCPFVITVESDPRFLSAVTTKAERNKIGEYHPLHADIGWTSEWGVPTFKTPTPPRVQRWKGYPQAPWPLLRERGLEPDMILIDGRFRVACALQSLLELPQGSDCRFFFDDVAAGDYYASPLQPFVQDFQMQDRLATFRKSNSFDENACRTVLEAHYADLR